MNTNIDAYVIGVDFGTDSVRSVLVHAGNGKEIAASVFAYPRWKKGLYCDAASNRFRQHPQDYIEGIEATIRSCTEKAGNEIAAKVVGISVDTTGSTPVAVDKTGTPLALLPQFAENPNAMFVLWKDHTAVHEAAELNAHTAKLKAPYLDFVGGIYSSEWFWAKLLHILREDETVRASVYSWVEHCDWIPFLLTGGNDVHQMKRGVCSAGHKSLWAEQFNGLPPDSFFSSWDPLLKGFTERLFSTTYTSAQAAGTLSAAWAAKLGLPETVTVGVGAFDCHMGAVGGQIEPYHLSKVMGTSTCDMLVAPVADMQNKLVRGICGQVDGSIIPGMIGMEAGQSAFGDAYAWFANLLAWPLQNVLNETSLISQETAQQLTDEVRNKLIAKLSDAASKITVTEETELAIDWLNGRRTPDANQALTSAFSGLDLGTDAPAMFRALAEATCFGAKAIVDRFRAEGVPVNGIIALGGVARKSPFVMQLMADTLNMPIRVHSSEQTCAIGAAMFAATAAGLYPVVEDAMQAMGQGFDMHYQPNREKAALLSKRYQRYTDLGTYIEKQTAIL